MKRVSINFLGRCEVQVPDGDLVAIGNSKPALLLARLAARPGESHDRRRLTELLWPDRDDTQALASLRQALWVLRRQLGDNGQAILLSDRTNVWLDPLTVDIDTVRFEELAHMGSPEALAQATALYRGDYLAEIDVDDADELSPFRFERQRLRGLQLSSLKTLVRTRAELGDANGAMDAARKALAIDPLQEDVHAAIIRVHRDTGQLGLARQHYKACRDLLERELGVKPSAEMEALRASLGNSPERATPPGSPAPPPAHLAPVVSPSSPPTIGAEVPATVVRRPHRTIVYPTLAFLVTMLVVVAWFVFSPSRVPLHAALPDSRPSLAVLPFADIKGDEGVATLSAGLTDSLIDDLAKVSGLFVFAADTSQAIAGTGVEARQRAARLGVSYAVQGAVSRLADGFRMEVELVRSESGATIWSRTYTGPGSDLFAVQDDMVRNIAAALGVQLDARERRTIDRIPTHNLEAQDYFLRAERPTSGLTEADGFRRALAYYRRAFELDPSFARAYSGYARIAATVWRRDLNEIMSSAVAKKEAYDAAGRAMQIDSEDSRAYEVLSIIQAVEGEHDIAVESARKAVSLQPGDAESHTNLATVLYFAGDLDAAATEAALANSLNPASSTDLRLLTAMLAFSQHHYPIAIREFGVVKALVPRSELVLEHLAAAYAYMGDADMAKATVAELKELVPITNLGFYAVMTQNTGTAAQTAHFIEGLRRAGIPQWPFDDRRGDKDKLGEAELRSILTGHGWTGALANGVAFVQDFDRNGGFAYASAASLLTGKVEIRGGQLCQVIEGYLLDRPSCGSVFRSTQPSDLPGWSYVYVSIDAVKYFNVSH